MDIDLLIPGKEMLVPWRNASSVQGRHLQQNILPYVIRMTPNERHVSLTGLGGKD